MGKLKNTITMRATITIMILTLMPLSMLSQKNREYPKAYVNFSFFEEVVKDAKLHRANRLISFAKFNKMSKNKNTIILDTRSKKMYDKMHIKGAVHLNFSDFTIETLSRIIPTKDTRILIYCNNNFEQKYPFLEAFPTKKISPKKTSPKNEPFPEKTLALNIPTFINLFGYGYTNVYELDELLSSDSAVELEGNRLPIVPK
ncbi:rhodanese-like domain-containing protein [Aquimarina algiphila]|uniref:rhodanese-like domain-containing protein n=1 Tax=Aquimarina algiphila TaxID=2047982 RepID=UPI00248FC269|nr:rhodanese-like domain-containing protein [Aquimarina algiphila]